MEQKNNDMLLNVMENPSFSIADFQDIGLDVSNTSLQSKDVYQNSPQIQSNPIFQDNNGNFDQTKFNTVYDTAVKAYNTMANAKAPSNDGFKVQYSKYDIFAPADEVNFAPDFTINTHEVNPDQTSYSLIRVGQQGPRTKTPQEIAQSQKVYNPATGEWEASPEDSFLGNLKDVRALAQYDFDVDNKGRKRGDAGFDENNIEHHAGELKINPETGTYYYEDLNGRNINGRQILHLSDVITKEDSPINAIDFLDSDDIHKSAVGSFVKNAALVGSMFLPVVGPWVTGATIIQQAASMGATLGKIATSSDNKLFNFIQGASEASNPFRTRSEYSQQNLWTAENLFGMIGDTVAQLKQQRMLFEQLPRIVGKDSRVLTEKGQQEIQNELLQKYNATNAKTIQDKFKLPMQELAKQNPTEFLNATEQLRIMNTNKAAIDLENYVKDYYNVGSVLSKAYMTLLTVNDTYDQAKQAGASDQLAALTTLGYAAGEYALLSTGLGEWIMPELRATRMKNKAVLNALTKDTIKSFEVENAKATTPALKHKLWSKAINYGKKIFNADYAVGKQSTLGKTLSSTVAASLGEGTEEVSEDILQSFVNTMYNLYNSTTGSSSRMYNENWKDQYLMDFLGGALGGGIANVSMNFHTAKETNNMTTEKAAQQLVYMMRNPEQMQDFYKMLDKTDLGNKYLSATKTIKDANGNIIGYEQGTDEDNQDKAIKDLVRQNVNLIKNTLEADGGNIDDKSLFDANTLKDLRWQYLYNSTTTARLIQNFNDLNVKALKLHNDINQISQSLPDQKYKEGSPEYEDVQKRLKEKQDELKDIQQQISDIREGKKATLYMAPALLETSPYVLQGFLKSSTFEGFAETKEGKAFNDISEERKNQLKQDYNNYVNTSKKDDIDIATQEYLNATRLFGQHFNDIQKAYESLSQNKEIIEGLQKVIDANNILNSVKDPDQWIEVAQNLSTSIVNQLKDNDPIKEQALRLQKAFDNFNTSGTVTKDINQVLSEGVNDFDSISGEAYGRAMNKLFKDNLVNNLVAQVSTLQQLGSVPAQTKAALSTYIDQAINLLSNYKNNTIEDLYDTGDFDAADNNDIELGNTINQLNKAKEDLDSLPYTPIMQIADNYIESVYGGNQVKVSELFTKLQSLENQSTSDISQFLLTDDLSNQITQVDRVLNQLQSISEGARTDDASLVMFDNQTVSPKDNIWGINKTLNDVAKQSKDKEWEELPTISKPLADALFVDLQSLKSKLNYYKTLYGINKGQKLNGQNRIALHNAYLNYRKVKTLSDIVPEDWDKTDLETILPTLKTLDANYRDDNLNLNKEDSINIRKEQISLEDALYNFFDKNKDKDLSQLFNESTYKIFTQGTTLLNEKTQDIDSSSFVGWLASKAVLKSSTFYKSLSDLFSKSKLVPLDSQLQAIQLSVANVINGNLVTKFSQAARKAALDYFNNLGTQERFDFAKNTLGYSDTFASILATDTGKDLIKLTPFINRYDNITLIEGIPGGGKSSAVLKLTSDFLKKHYPDSLQNAWVVNTNEDTAKKLRGNLGLSEGENLDRKTLLTKISNWTEPKIDNNGNITLDDKHSRLKKTLDISSIFNIKDIPNVPKVIFIDEVSRFTTDELDLIDNFAKKNGISVIAAGDFNQSQTNYQLSLNELVGLSNVKKIQKEIKDAKLPINDIVISKLGEGTKINTFTSRNNLLHVSKIGSSIRTANSQQDQNQQTVLAAQTQLENDLKTKVSILLHYWESERDIHGTKVLSPAMVEDTLKTLDKMILNLKKDEKIGYVYYNTNSEIYKAINSQPKYKDHIDFYKGNSAQGLEGKYWIIETNPNKTDESLLQDIYTGITRASIGSMLILPSSGGPFNTLTRSGMPGRIEFISNAPADTDSQVLKFSDADKSRFTKRFIDILNSALDTNIDDVPKYVERSKINIDTNRPEPTSPPISEPSTDEPKESFEEWFAKYKAQADDDIAKANIQDLADIQATIASQQNLLNSIPESDKDKRTAIQNTIDQLQDILIQKQNKIDIDSTDSGINFDEITPSIDGDLLIFHINQNIPGKWINKLLHNYTDTYNDQTLQTINFNTKNGSITLKTNENQYVVNINDLNDTKLLTFLNSFSNLPSTLDNDLHTSEEEITSILEGESEDNDTSDIEQQVTITVQPTLPASDESKPVHDTFLLDSTKTFELGWIQDDNGFHPSGNSTHRIDGFNGIFNDDGSLKLHTTWAGRPKSEYFVQAINMIGMLRRLALNEKDKPTLIKRISNILGLHDNVYITFGIKSSEIDNNIDPNHPYSKFDKSSQEQIQFSDNSQQELGRNLVMIIGDKSGDKLEIPIIKLNSPQSKIQSLGDDYKVLYQQTRDQVTEDLQKSVSGEISDGLIDRETLLRLKDSPKLATHPDIKDWITIYCNTNNSRTIFFNYDKDWTPAKGFHNLGPQYNAFRGSTLYNGSREDLIENTRSRDLQDLAQRPDVRISSVMTYPDPYNHGYITTDSGQVKIISNPGHIFVLYTTNPKYVSDKDMVEQYIKQQIAKSKGEDYDPDIHIKYISTPEISINNYLDSVLDYTMSGKKLINADGKKEYTILGNNKTPYLVLKSIFIDKDGNPINTDEIKQLIGTSWGDSDQIYNFLLSTIQRLNKLDQSSLMAELTSTVDWTKDTPDGFGFSSKSMSQQFTSVLKQMVAPVQIKEDAYGDFNINWRGQLNQDHYNLFVDLFNKSGQKIYFQARMENAEKADIGQGFKKIKVDSNNPYQIYYTGKLNFDKNFKVFGEIGPNMYITDESFSSWLHDIATNKLRIGTDGQAKSSDNPRYAYDNNSNIEKSIQVTPTFSKPIQDMINDYSFIKALNLQPTKVNDGLSNVQEVQVINAFLNNGIYAIGINTSIILEKKDTIKTQDIDHFETTEGVTTSIFNTNGVNEYNYVVVMKDGSKYNAYYNNTTKTTRLIPIKTPPTQEPQNIELPILDASTQQEYLQFFRTFAQAGPVVRNVSQQLASSSVDNLASVIDFINKKRKPLKKQIANYIDKASNDNPEYKVNNKYDVNAILEDSSDLQKQILSSILNYEENTSCTIGL